MVNAPTVGSALLALDVAHAAGGMVSTVVDCGTRKTGMLVEALVAHVKIAAPGRFGNLADVRWAAHPATPAPQRCCRDQIGRDIDVALMPLGQHHCHYDAPHIPRAATSMWH